jgi:hypothetical protein
MHAALNPREDRSAQANNEQEERKLQMEASSLTVDILRQLGVVLPEPSRLVRDLLDPVGHFRELSIDRPEV